MLKTTLNSSRIYGRLLLTAIVILLCSATLMSATEPKRELRGTWLQTVYQDGYARRSTKENQQYLTDILDRLEHAGINVVFFQIRPSADAFYKSDLEPWSRFLTGITGKAPSPQWDPLQFMIDECHNRGMELHAWLNPYRVTTSAKETLPPGHLYRKHPERFVRYGKKIYFDPGIPENRKHILKVVSDIITRYDVDGIHFDDYFYPYPVKGVRFPDARSYARYGKGQKLGDWRRNNVNMLISEVHRLIADNKPWIRFGVSPFGIWRNAASDPKGSDSSGLQNYDDLYADIQLWAQKGWIDYQMPQLYWEIGHPAACYSKLLTWWKDNAHDRHLYIGQDIARINKHGQLRQKFQPTRDYATVQGNVWWYGYSLADNAGCIADSLASTYHCTKAIVPEYPWICADRPDRVDNTHHKGRTISWPAAKESAGPEAVNRWVIYWFASVDEIDTAQPQAIDAIVYKPLYTAKKAGVYVITALNRANNESEASAPIIIK